ncbi:hypothetical protein B296_00058306 [Ensete ventricosum]|uniref:tRNA uridine(34) hydroxylase N-terminal domain-containing protein n=1 Tax=Ensete ventricosum TaxID=4639 RepID=A0A426XMQ0_ENSVE|nr:hypothetical protein B296_00058306 [Ensete ventricosum]
MDGKRRPMLSSPPLAFSKSSCGRGAAAALLRRLSRPSVKPNPNPNPNPSGLRLPMASGAEKTVTPHHHHTLNLSGPNPFIPSPQSLQIAAPRVLSGSRGISSSVAALSSSEAADGPAPLLVVVSFYRFADFPDHAAMRQPLKDLCEDLVSGKIHLFVRSGPDSVQCVSGGIILAPEGINGSICGTPASVEKVLKFIQSDERLKGLRLVESPVSPEDEAIHHGHTSHSPLGAGEDAPFRWDHVRVKLKQEVLLVDLKESSFILM